MQSEPRGWRGYKTLTRQLKAIGQSAEEIFRGNSEVAHSDAEGNSYALVSDGAGLEVLQTRTLSLNAIARNNQLLARQARPDGQSMLHAYRQFNDVMASITLVKKKIGMKIKAIHEQMPRFGKQCYKKAALVFRKEYSKLYSDMEKMIALRQSRAAAKEKDRKQQLKKWKELEYEKMIERVDHQIDEFALYGTLGESTVSLGDTSTNGMKKRMHTTSEHEEAVLGSEVDKQVLDDFLGADVEEDEHADDEYLEDVDEV